MVELNTGMNGKSPGWLSSVVFHCGSKFGNRPVFKDSLEEICTHLSEIGVNNIVFGGGKSGLMGAAAKGALDAGVAVDGITLPFFAAAQGQELDGVRSVRSAFSMTARKRAMRDSSQASFTIGGGNGTMEETLEWVNSRNGILKPLISLNIGGFADGMQEFTEKLIETGYANSTLRDRIYFEPTTDAFVERAMRLNSEAPRAEPESDILHVDLGQYIKERPNAVIVHPGPLQTVESIMERLVIYDVCNIDGVHVEDAAQNGGHWDIHDRTMFLPDKVLKPVIFVNEDGHFDGFKRQLQAMCDEGFIAPDRKRFVHFADYTDDAEDMARELERQPQLTAADVGKKHSESEHHPAI